MRLMSLLPTGKWLKDAMKEGRIGERTGSGNHEGSCIVMQHEMRPMWERYDGGKLESDYSST